MIRSTMTRGLLVAAAVLLASTASAEAPNANVNTQGKGQAADPAKRAAAGDEKAKGDDKARGDTKNAKSDDKSADRAVRKAKEHDAERAKLTGMLKAPPDEAMKLELRRHAERVARLDRIKVVATDAKDADAGDRATKLLAKENARHDKWMEKQISAAPAAQPAAPAMPVTPVTPATKEGAK
jgi:hypothetical protein